MKKKIGEQDSIIK